MSPERQGSSSYLPAGGWTRFRILDLLERVDATDPDKDLLYAMWMAAVASERPV